MSPTFSNAAALELMEVLTKSVNPAMQGWATRSLFSLNLVSVGFGIDVSWYRIPLDQS